MTVVNDICSWDKELKSSRDSATEGSALCSSVLIVSEQLYLGVEGAKRILWTVCREWEDRLIHLLSKITLMSPRLLGYDIVFLRTLNEKS
ncbi:uncharacterized protein BJX67DRAFT_342720 [Aspergillus lucknowensis]|uniref:Uncharacterized protein n=1 Tax=Aspergillus lucknowensis TaxID=176173 RepID=A0ABR4M4U2_9EURO